MKTDPTPENKEKVGAVSHLLCNHQFMDLLSRNQRAKHGLTVWFFCPSCLMTVKKKLTDESNEL